MADRASGTERGHDTRPGEIEAVARAAWDYAEQREAKYVESYRPVPWERAHELDRKEYRKYVAFAIAALDAFRAEVPDVSR